MTDTTDTTTLASLAGDAYDQFERRTRPDESTFTTLKDGAPEWLGDLVHDAHGDMLPDDWRYESIRAALGAVHDGDAETEYACDEIRHEFADGNCDHYNAALVEWLGSHAYRPVYCDEAIAEFGADQDSGIMAAIQRGQYVESEEIFASVVQSLVSHLDDLDA